MCIIPVVFYAIRMGFGTSKHSCLVSYLLCWRRHVSATVGHLQVTENYNEENHTEHDHSIGAYSKLSTRSRCRLDYTYWATSLIGDNISSIRINKPTMRSRWKFRICTYTIIMLCIVFLYIYFCDLKVAHSGRNMSSTA